MNCIKRFFPSTHENIQTQDDLIIVLGELVNGPSGKYHGERVLAIEVFSSRNPMIAAKTILHLLEQVKTNPAVKPMLNKCSDFVLNNASRVPYTKSEVRYMYVRVIVAHIYNTLNLEKENSYSLLINGVYILVQVKRWYELPLERE